MSVSGLLAVGLILYNIEYIFSSPDDAVDQRKLGFYFFKQQFKASLEQFYILYEMLSESLTLW